MARYGGTQAPDNIYENPQMVPNAPYIGNTEQGIIAGPAFFNLDKDEQMRRRNSNYAGFVDPRVRAAALAQFSTNSRKGQRPGNGQGQPNLLASMMESMPSLLGS